MVYRGRFMNWTNRAASLLLPLSLVAATACSGEETPTVERPAIVAFTATPIDVAAGGTTMLRWEVMGAQSVQIDIDGGANVLPATSNLSGSVVSPTLDATTTFVLKAANAGGVASMTVTVTVGGGTGAPQVTAFTANPAALQAPGATTLSWQTTGGETLRIEANGSTVHMADAGSVAAGTHMLQVDATTTYTLVVVNASGQASSMTTVTVGGGPSMPTIDSFTAAPATINAGGSATLAWTVRDATNITITDSSSAVLTMSTTLDGTFAVTPAQTETYTLTAVDANSNTATRNVVVTVSANPGATIVSFTATPSSIAEGGSSTLAWNVTNAPEGIDIRENGTSITTSAMATGTFVVTPAATTTYELVALNAAMGDANQSVTVTVTPAGQPVVTSFTAAPTVVAAGTAVTLSWATASADQIRILDGGTEVFVDTTNVATGSTMLTPTADTTYTIEATLAGALPATATVDVFVHAAPVVNTFTVAPTTLTAAGPVTVTWDVANVSALALTLDGTAVAGFPTVTSTGATQSASGTLSVQVTQTGTFQLTATSAAGTLSPSQTVTVNNNPNPNMETEPNDDFGTANPFPATGGIVGALTADDFDFYTVTVPAGGSVTAQTSDGMGGCATDTVLFLAGPGGIVIAQDDNDGTGNCSSIAPATDAGAADLVAGTYFVVVAHSSDTGVGSYTLDVTVAPALCGNDIIETNANEQCDGGNTTPGDGCNASCQIEIEPTVIGGAGGTVVLNFPAGTPFRVVQVNIATDGQAIAAVAADPSGTTCNSVDTAINLADAQLVAIGGKADGGPVGTAGDCAALLYPTDAFSRNLAAGTYYLVVFAEGGTGSVQLSVTIQNPVCGNSAFETRAEQCDDGNIVANDGCDAACNLELTQTVSLPAASPIVVASSFGAGAFDTYQINVATETFVRVETFGPNVAAGCNVDTFIILRDANQNVIGFDDEGGTMSCSRMDETQAGLRLAPGTYYAQVFEFSDLGIGAYEIRFESVAIGATAPLFDVEPNDNQAAAQASGLAAVGSVTLQGRLNPAGDDDVWSVSVPANQDLVLIARTHDTQASPTMCGAQNPVTDTRVFIEQAGLEATGPGTLEVAYNDDADAANNVWCSAVGANVSGGATGATYYVRVQGFADDGIRAYYLTLQLQP